MARLGLLFVVCLSLIPSRTVCAQQPSPASPHDNEAVIIERLETRVSYENDGTGFREITAAIRMQSEAGPQSLGVLRFPYAKENEVLEFVYVRVRKPDGSVVITPDAYVQDMPEEVSRTAPMYSDLREKQVAVKGLSTGDLLEYQMRWRVVQPQVPGEFWYIDNFSTDVITKVETLEIRVPAGREVNVKSPLLKADVKVQDGKRIHTWTTNNLKVERTNKKRKNNEKEPEPKTPAIQISTFRDWDAIGRWFEGLQKDRVVITPAISAKASELTKNSATQEEKLRAIYHFVATRFRYIGISFGIGRYQPHPATEVLENEYGDCKDKHTLLAALLKSIGIDALPVLVNSTLKLDSDVPSLGQFDHVITYVALGDKEYWLDTTPEVAPFGLVLRNLRGEQGLLIAAEKPRLVRIPETPPFPITVTFHIEAKLAPDGSLKGRVERTARGDAEVILRAAFRNTPKSQWQELVQALSYGTGYGGDVSNVDAERPEDTSKPFRYSYDYTRKDFGDWEKRRVPSAMPPRFGIEVPQDDDELPERPIDFGELGEIVFSSQMEFPAGYVFERPADVSATQDFADYNSRYSVRGNVLFGERKLVLKAREVPTSRWKDLKAFSKNLTDDENNWITLRSSDEPPEFATTSEQDKIFENARQAFERRNLAEVESNLDRLMKLNPRYPMLWVVSGQIKMMKGDMFGAEADFQKEIDYHPRDVRAHATMALTQVTLGKRDKAIGTWEHLLQTDPENLDAHIELSNLFAQAGKYEQVIAHLDPVMKKGTENPWLISRLGVAQVKVGKAEEGRQLLKRAIEIEPSHLMRNNVAYSLAEGGVDLPYAKELSEQSVAELEGLTVQTKLGTLTMDDVRRPSGIASYWDTLGWIYYGMKDDVNAEGYLLAAWMLSQSSTTAEHLGMLYERQGRKTEARRMYQLGLADVGPRSNRESLSARLEALGETPARKSARYSPEWRKGMRAGEELSKLRTVKLPRFSTKRGSAEYFVLLTSDGRVEDVRMISGDEYLKEAGDHLRRATYNQSFPASSKAKILRKCIVMCSEIPAACSAVLMTPDMVSSVE